MLGPCMVFADGWAKRRLNSPRRAPAMWGMTPSNTCRPCSSALKPSHKKCRKQRPLCDVPKPNERLTTGLWRFDEKSERFGTSRCTDLFDAATTSFGDAPSYSWVGQSDDAFFLDLRLDLVRAANGGAP